MRTLQPCGTSAAYRRHLNRGETCRTCLDAVAREAAAKRAETKARLRAEIAAAVSDTAGPGPDEAAYEWYREMSTP